MYGDKTSNTLLSIIAQATGYVKVLVDGGVWSITENVTVPVNVALEIFPDATLNISDGILFTVNSASFLVHRPDWWFGDGAVGGTTHGGRFIGVASHTARILPEAVSEGLEFDDDDLLKVKLATAVGSSEGEAITPKAVQDHVASEISSLDVFDPSTYTGVESITFPNGLILKHGFEYDSDQSDHTFLLTFEEAFPNSVVSCSIVPLSALDNGVWGVRDYNTSRIKVWIRGQSHLEGWFWQAWGK